MTAARAYCAGLPLAAVAALSFGSGCAAQVTSEEPGSEACGDTICDSLEHCASCPEDCGSCAPSYTCDWFASPTASTGTGGEGDPWSLSRALDSQAGSIQPGDTLCLRGGVYAGSFTASSNLAGDAANPIHVRAYPGERPIIDGNGSTNSTLNVDSSHVWFWDLEVMNSRTDRYCASCLGLRPTGVYVRTSADNIKLVHMVIHDTGHGVYTEYVAPNIELYGLIIYNGGNDNDTRSDGHGIYVKNDSAGVKLFRELVIFNQFGFGVHAYQDSSTTGGLDNMQFVGNVLFNNGEPSLDDNPNFQIGGNRVSDRIVITDNASYFSPGLGSMNFRIGYDTLLNAGLDLAGNTIVGGSDALVVNYWSSATIENNTVVGAGNMVRFTEWSQDPVLTGYMWNNNLYHRDPSASAWRYDGTNRDFGAWKSLTGFDSASNAVTGLPAANRIALRASTYQAGRAHIVVYNWEGLPAVAVDVSAVLQGGDSYTVHSVQDLFGAAVAGGTYAGGAISIPMTAVTPPAPIGGSPNAPLITGPAFDVFVLRRL